MMLAKVLRGWWRSMTGGTAHRDGVHDSSDTGSGSAIREAVRAEINAFLREPLTHPAAVDFELIARLQAAASSADYMVAHMMNAQNLVRRAELLEFALGACTIDGLIMEFGVFRGESLRFIAKRVRQEVHGFDSFEGLPEDWTYFQKQGRFSLDGAIPEFAERNICVYKGWFEQTLPGFLAAHDGAARLLHIDCDIYSSTRTILELVAPRIVPGTVIVFDEYLNYPSWQAHEFRAFQEFVAAGNLRYRYAGFASSHSSVAVVVE
jgi:hypothetical protein